MVSISEGLYTIHSNLLCASMNLIHIATWDYSRIYSVNFYCSKCIKHQTRFRWHLSFPTIFAWQACLLWLFCHLLSISNIVLVAENQSCDVTECSSYEVFLSRPWCQLRGWESTSVRPSASASDGNQHTSFNKVNTYFTA